MVILISGVRGAGKGETVNLLNAWMDPRHIHTHAFDNPTDEERDRPPMWRYWRALPPKGKIGMLFGSWYTAPIIDRVFKRTRPGDLAVHRPVISVAGSGPRPSLFSSSPIITGIRTNERKHS